ncbi:hypothetical protein BDY24DRAFT_402635 [Mrakia frigida]|uniref:uncharacterized protein n=1 Tax=Mrakia frigida TaxID=29902 RepID=UPI003FCC240F
MSFLVGSGFLFFSLLFVSFAFVLNFSPSFSRRSPSPPLPSLPPRHHTYLTSYSHYIWLLSTSSLSSSLSLSFFEHPVVSMSSTRFGFIFFVVHSLSLS